MVKSRDGLADQINKRLTLNLLIQGCAQHAFLTSHHLVRDELNAINPKLLLLYDKFSLAAFIQYWYGASVLVCGHPAIFWTLATRFLHRFSRHPLLSRHGRALATAAKHRALERCRLKGVHPIPAVFSFQLIYLMNRIAWAESGHATALIELAKRITTAVWGIPEDRLDAQLTRRVAFGRLRLPTTYSGALLRACPAGYGGVLFEDSPIPQLQVVAKAWNWPILSHELVKGTAELICLHGLGALDDETYARVVRAADRIEYEPWMLQAGSELWRQILPLLPDGVPLAESLMHIARLPPHSLHTLMAAVIENPAWARELLCAIITGLIKRRAPLQTSARNLMDRRSGPL